MGVCIKPYNDGGSRHGRGPVQRHLRKGQQENREGEQNEREERVHGDDGMQRRVEQAGKK